MGLGFRVWGLAFRSLGFRGLYWDNGKWKGNYYLGSRA